MTLFDQLRIALKIERDIAKAEAIIASNPTVLEHDNQGVALFESAARRGDIESMALLRNHGVDVNATLSHVLAWGPIDDAAINGHHEAVRWLIHHGAVVNPVCNGQRHSSALMGSCLWGHLDCVRVLVEHGAEINANWEGKNPLRIAQEQGHSDISQYLRSKGAKLPEELDHGAPTKTPSPKTKRKK